MDDDRSDLARALSREADRLDALADVADLMDDEAGALRLRQQCTSRRLQAMALLDDPG